MAGLVVEAVLFGGLGGDLLGVAVVVDRDAGLGLGDLAEGLAGDDVADRDVEAPGQ